MKIRFMLILCCLWWVAPTHSGALTIEEILLLKQNGVSEQTIQMMLESEMQARPGNAAEEQMGVKTITRPDDKSAIVYSTGSGDQDVRYAEERLKEEQAWEMLHNIIVDTRKTDGRGRRTEE